MIPLTPDQGYSVLDALRVSPGQGFFIGAGVAIACMAVGAWLCWYWMARGS